MKKYISVIYISIFAAIMITGCTNNDTDSLIKENEALKTKVAALEQVEKENEELKAELNQIKFSPAVLITEINKYYKDKEYNKLLDTVYLLSEKHPDSAEAKKALQIKEEIMQIAIKNKEKAKFSYDSKSISDASKALKERMDEELNMTWYTDISNPIRTDINAFYIYFGMKDKNLPWLRLRVQYAGQDLLLINKYTINADNEVFEIIPTLYSVKRNEAGGLSWEWFDTSADKSTYRILKSMIGANTVNVTCEGERGKISRTLSLQEKNALKNILVLYEVSGGILNTSEN